MDPGSFIIYIKTRIKLKNNGRVYCIMTENISLSNSWQ